MYQTKGIQSFIPTNETERLGKLYSYEILDTPAEITFEKIAALAALIFKSPIAQINFVDSNRVFFKSNISQVQFREVKREDSFCSRSILSDDITIFRDTHQVPELTENKFVTEFGVRFYAGAPLKTKEGFKIGTVCVLDTVPRDASEDQLKMLESLSSIVVDELELRLAARKAVRVQTDMVNRVVHDLKNPNTTIKLSAELIRMKAGDAEIVKNLSGRIISAADSVLTNLNNLLDISQAENGNVSIVLEPYDLCSVLDEMKNNLELIATNKGQTIEVIPGETAIIAADKSKLQEIFENLITNALKFSAPNTVVKIITSVDGSNAVIEVQDSGLGLDDSDMGKLFTKFAKLSSVPTGKEHSNGLGLFLVKTLVDLHKGRAWATSGGKGKGSSFFVSLPLYTAI